MFRTLRILIVSVSLVIIWNAPGSAFQLFANDPTPQALPITSLKDGTASEKALGLGEEGEIDPGNDRMNIWIPGLGVVGKMPKLDFGLEMLYGAPDIAREAPPSAHELKQFDSDFAIKGTIKRKF